MKAKYVRWFCWDPVCEMIAKIVKYVRWFCWDPDMWNGSDEIRGWSGGAKVCILCHRGVQLILAYSWARPAILVAGKGRGGMFLFLLFLHFHSCSSFFPVPLSSLRLSLLSLFSLSLGDDTKWPTRVDVSLNPNTIKSDEIQLYQMILII